MKLLIKYASRGRKEMLMNALGNIMLTLSNPCNFNIIVSLDEDESHFEGTVKQSEVTFISGPHISKVHAINRDIPTDWDWLVNMSDDMRFIQQDWDLKMLADIRKVWPKGTDFFAHFNDGFVGEKLPTMSIIGRGYYERDGYIYHPSYNSVSCDAEAMYVAMMRGKHHYFPEVYFNHLHPANTRKPTDSTYQGNHKFDGPDTANYFERMKHGFYVKSPVMIPDEVKKYMNE